MVRGLLPSLLAGKLLMKAPLALALALPLLLCCLLLVRVNKASIMLEGDLEQRRTSRQHP
jgi:hypothetical protein